MPEPIIIVAIITVLGGAVGSGVGIAIKGILDRKKAAAEIKKTEADTAKIDADAADMIAKAAGDAVDRLLPHLNQRIDGQQAQINAQQKQISEMNGTIDGLEKEVGDQKCLIDKYGQRVVILMRGIKLLLSQLEGLNQVPVWTPDDWQP